MIERVGHGRGRGDTASSNKRLTLSGPLGLHKGPVWRVEVHAPAYESYVNDTYIQ